jgi:membrane protein required for colicin V production
MAVLDWIFLVVLLGSLFLGAWRGLVYELLSLLSWIAAFVVAQWFAPQVGLLLPMTGASEMVRYAAGFVVVFLVVVFAVSLVAWLAKKLLDSVGLRPADRALGSVFGMLRGLIFLLAATVVIEMTPLKTSTWWRESIGAGITSAALKGLKPLLPQEFGKYLPQS